MRSNARRKRNVRQDGEEQEGIEGVELGRLIEASAAFVPRDYTRVGVAISETRPIHAGFVVLEATKALEYDMHYGLEIGVVITGKMRRSWRTWEKVFEPGEVWLCGIWERHAWQVIEGPCEHLVLVILPEMLLDPGLPLTRERDMLAPFRAAPERRPQASGEMRQEILGLIRQIIDELTTEESPTRSRVGMKDMVGQVWVRLLTLELLCTLQEGWSAPTRVQQRPESLERLSAAVELVFASQQMVKTSEAAREVGMSESAFKRVFTGLTGLTFAKFALRHRLSSAAAQLLRTQDTIKEVAKDWGFTDDSHLHRAFVLHYGVSPREYRERRWEKASRIGRRSQRRLRR